jgi:hypothetical protein
MGSPHSLSAEQHDELESSGRLQFLNSPEWTGIEKRTFHLEFDLPRQGLRLLRIAW